MKRKHICNNTNGNKWYHCSACGGRCHEVGCTTRKNPMIDCCKKRHELLHSQGHVRGMGDSSIEMLGSHQ